MNTPHPGSTASVTDKQLDENSKSYPVKLNRILCATDFSKCAEAALAYALEFSQQHDAELLLLHVFDDIPPTAGRFVDALLTDTTLREEATVQLREWESHAKRFVKATATLREGKKAYKQIVDFAKETGADLLVLGKHGGGVIDRIFVGSTADQVVRHAPCPVLVIPEANPAPAVG